MMFVSRLEYVVLYYKVKIFCLPLVALRRKQFIHTYVCPSVTYMCKLGATLSPGCPGELCFCSRSLRDPECP